MAAFASAPSRAAIATALRGAAAQAGVVMAATLASFGSAYGIEHAADLGTGIVIQAVVLAMTLAGVEQRRTSRPAATGRRWAPLPARLLLLPVIAVAAAEIGTLMLHHPNVGDTLFVVGISAAIWVRRFGPAATRAGTLATMPLIALLVVPASAGPGASRWWSALIALIAALWVLVTRAAAERIGLVPRPPLAVPAARPPARTESTRTESTRTESTRTESTRTEPTRTEPNRWWTRPWRAKPAASTRMAAQMALALAAAFAVGRWAFPSHWPWLVLTAYIVGAGNRGRGDVAVKGVARLAGGLAGTAGATAALAAAPAHSTWTVVAIFIVLAAALLLRQIHYAFWAAGVTALLALLYGYFGVTTTSMLTERLEAIAVGSAIAVAAAWLLAPIRSRDVARGRIARALAALTEVLLAVARAQTQSLPVRRVAFRAAVTELDQLTGTLKVRRWLWRALRRPGPYLADASGGVIGALATVEVLADAARETPSALAGGALRRRCGALARELGVVRRAIAGQPEPAGAAPPGTPGQVAPATEAPVETALAELEAAVAVLRAVFPSRPAEDGPADQPPAHPTAPQAAAGTDRAAEMSEPGHTVAS